MYFCKICRGRFNTISRVKALFNKDNILICTKCGSKYKQSVKMRNISFYFAVITYFVFSLKLFLVINNFLGIYILSLLLHMLIGAVWMIFVVYLSQFLSKFNIAN